MQELKIKIRKFVPEKKIINVSKDKIRQWDDNLLITEWLPRRAREDMSGGISFAFFDKGYKISWVYKGNYEFAFWYCDIIGQGKFSKSKKTFSYPDLMADVKISPDGKVTILDLHELADALEKSLITKKQSCDALRSLNSLLEIIDKGEFPPPIVSEFLKDKINFVN